MTRSLRQRAQRKERLLSCWLLEVERFPTSNLFACYFITESYKVCPYAGPGNERYVKPISALASPAKAQRTASHTPPTRLPHASHTSATSHCLSPPPTASHSPPTVL